MHKATDKKIIEKTIIAVIICAFFTSPAHLLWAEDYPAYIGAGYREYLSGKIQNGYFVEEFTKIDRLQKERVEKRNQTEEIVIYSYQATPQSSNVISNAALLEKYNSDKLKAEVALQRQQREKAAAAQGEFTYIPYTDGKKVYFKDGLPRRIENERVPDEFGNLNIKNTYNMQYNDKRLLVSYEAILKDNLGNISQLFWYGAKYTADSLFYGGKDTVANKNITEYWLKEIDPAGNEKLTHWNGSSYEGKFLRAFSQTIEDAIYGYTSFTRTNITYAGGDPDLATSYHEEGIGTDGLAYSLDRTNISYNGKGQLAGYHEEKITTQIDGGKVKTTVDAQSKYLETPKQFGPDVEEPDPDRLLESIITTTIEDPDGSFRTETNTISYKYEGYKLIGAQGHSEFSGQEADWWQYTDAQGHILIRDEDEEGNTTYFYIDPDTKETITVASDQVTATLKDGNKYNGTSDIQYEILYGKPMTKQVDSTVSYYHPESNDLLRTDVTTVSYTNGLKNNLLRVLNTQEHAESTYTQVDEQRRPQREVRDVTTTYIYAENGNLMDAVGLGTGSGYELTGEGWMNYTSEINIDYEVILGEAKQKRNEVIKDYYLK